MSDLSVARRAPAALPADLVLTPTRRRPLQLSAETERKVISRPLPPFDDRRPSPDSVQTSVIVVTHDHPVCDRLCLESVLRTTDPSEVEILVVDNGSGHAAARYLRELSRRIGRVQLLRNNTNEGFAAANNQALKVARGENLVLLNNDTITTDGWLDNLTAMLTDESVGLLGPVTNRCGNEAQINAPYKTIGGLVAFAADRGRRHGRQLRDIPMPAMFCAAMRRGVFERIGPLDEQFEVGLFEDEDYALRVRAAGFRTCCADGVFVHHFGQASLGRLAASGEYGRLFHANRRRFEAKWGRTWIPHRSHAPEGYRALIPRLSAAVERSVPRGATVAVVSRGDDELLSLGERRGWHFPCTADGRWAGHHPADSVAAIEGLEALRALGADHLLIPSVSFWWLTHYDDFRRHLVTNYRELHSDDDCLIIRLVEERSLLPARPSPMEWIIGELPRDVLGVTVAIPLPAAPDYRLPRELLENLHRHVQAPDHVVLFTANIGDEGVERLRQIADRHGLAVLATKGTVGTALARVCALTAGDVLLLDHRLRLTAGFLDRLRAAASETEAGAVNPRPPDGLSGSADVESRSPTETLAGGQEGDRPLCTYLPRRVQSHIGSFDASASSFAEALGEYAARARAAGHLLLAADDYFDAGWVTVPGAPGDAPSILCVLHDLGGGVHVAVADLVHGLAGEFRCLVLEAGPRHWRLSEAVPQGFRVLEERAFPEPWSRDGELDTHREAALDGWLTRGGIGLAHVHHLLGTGPGLIEHCANRGLPVLLTAHDAHLLCPTAHLLDENNRYCAAQCTSGPGPCPLNARYYPDGWPRLKHGAISEYRARSARMLGRCARVTAPSSSHAEFLAGALRAAVPGACLPEVRVVTPGIDLPFEAMAVAPDRDRRMRVLCPGNLNRGKGADIIAELIELNEQAGHPLEFHLLGRPARDVRLQGKGVIAHGSYRRAQFPMHVGEIRPSLALLVSVTAESYSYTLSECWACGLPAMVTERGALGARVRETGGGWCRPVSAMAVFDSLQAIRADPLSWRQATRAVGSIRLPGTSSAARAFARHYRELMRTTQPA